MNIDDYIVGNKLNIAVKPNSPKTKIVGYDNSKKALKVNVKAQPEKGKANAEIIKFFSKLTKKKIEIILGKTSKYKVLLLK
jgi:uncharacterized protein (TIGR00251 family)